MRYPMATLPILALAVPALLAAPGADELVASSCPGWRGAS